MKKNAIFLILTLCSILFFGCNGSESENSSANSFAEFCGTYSDLKTWRDTGILLEISQEDHILNINYTYHYHWEHLYDQEMSFYESVDISQSHPICCRISVHRQLRK